MDLFLARKLQVIHGTGPVFNTRLYSPRKIQFIGMDLGNQFVFRGCLKDLFGLVHAKKSPVAEDIHIVCQLFPGYRGQHLIDYFADIIIAPILIFRGKCMGTQKSGTKLDRKVFPEAPDHPQHLQFPFRR